MKLGSQLLRSMLGAALAVSVFALPSIVSAETRPRQAEATLKKADGTTVGRARFTQRGDLVEVRIDARGLPPGWLGFHVHEEGRCEGGEQFKTAGGHLGGADKDHPEHAGDLPPLLVTRSGEARLVAYTDRFAVGDLVREDGAALMIHVGPDNFAHFPERYGIEPDEETRKTGDAGDRLACGVVRPAQRP